MTGAAAATHCALARELQHFALAVESPTLYSTGRRGMRTVQADATADGGAGDRCAEPDLREVLASMHLQWFAAEDEGRTEEPTEHKIRKAREEGKVAKSQDVSSSVVLLFSVVALLLASRYMFSTSLDMVANFFRRSTEIDITTDATVVRSFYSYFIRLTIPVAMVAVAAAILGNVVQVGFLFTTKTITPDFNRVAPKFGRFFQRALLSTEALFNLGKSLGKVVLLAVLGFINTGLRTADAQGRTGLTYLQDALGLNR